MPKKLEYNHYDIQLQPQKIKYAEKFQMVGFDAENDDAIYHSSKFIEDVPLLIIAEIGRTQISVQKVLNLKKGNLVEFNKIVGEPMDVVVGGRLMARGEIVVVNERYGVRISEVTRPDEKIGARRE